MEGKTFDEIKFQRKMKIVPLKIVSSKIKLDDNVVVPVNPDTIFKRMILLKKDNEELKDFFEFELAPYPLSIFSENGMRKNKKSDFYDCFETLGNFNIHAIINDCQEIIFKTNIF